jgi:hypothetical protein
MAARGTERSRPITSQEIAWRTLSLVDLIASLVRRRVVPRSLPGKGGVVPRNWMRN